MKIKNSIISLFVIFALIISISYLLSLKFLRFDLTSEGRYTLSDYTKEILESLDDKLYIKVYLDGEGLPTTLRKYKQEIKEELDEFSIYAGDNLDFEFIDPAESPDNEVRYAFYKSLVDKGLYFFETNELRDDGTSTQKMVFPGASLTYKGRETVVNLLRTSDRLEPESEENVNNSVQSLEYELTNAIQKLSKEKKPRIAFLEGHGELTERQVMDISTVLSEYYTVMTGRIGGTPGILDDFKAVIIAKPEKPFPEADKFVIDQYIMNGGSVLWLIEGTNTNMDSLFLSGYTITMAQDLNLNDMLFEYGVRVNHDLIMDKQSSPIGLTIKGTDGDPRIKLFPWYFFPILVSDNDHVISKYLNFIKTEFVSSVDTVGSNLDIQKTILLKTSEYTKTEPIPARISFDMINSFPTDNEMKSGKKNIAVLLEGRFESVFKNRPVEKYIKDISASDIITKGKHAKMIVISDGDIIKNEFHPELGPYPIGFDRFTRETFIGNQEFILNALNYLCDDEGLMTIRARELQMRLLDQEKLRSNRFTIQLINVLLPVILILIFGLITGFIRKRKYQRK